MTERILDCSTWFSFHPVRLLKVKPEERLTIEGVLAHPWLNCTEALDNVLPSAQMMMDKVMSNSCMKNALRKCKKKRKKGKALYSCIMCLLFCVSRRWWLGSSKLMQNNWLTWEYKTLMSASSLSALWTTPYWGRESCSGGFHSPYSGFVSITGWKCLSFHFFGYDQFLFRNYSQEDLHKLEKIFLYLMWTLIPRLYKP